MSVESRDGGTPKGAVFLSYASEDAEAARRICEALRAAGVEVWFDQNELVGGDAWDAKIRKQIRECALFVPVISANTEARGEGYFRLEWRLAEQRTHLMGRKAFIFPICIDATRDAGADVPESFLAVQWARLPAGQSSAAFCERVKELLERPASPDTIRPFPAHRSTDGVVPPKHRTLNHALMAGAGIVVAGLALVAWQPWRAGNTTPSLPRPSAPVAKYDDEFSRLRARLIPHAWKKEDFEPFAAALDRILRTDEQNADAWALLSIINSLQVIRNFEVGTKPLEAGRLAANRALHLAPDAGLAQLALGMHLTAMNSRGGDPRAARPHLQRALAVLPADALTRFADVSWGINTFAFAELKESTDAWLTADPDANHAAFVRGMMHLALREPEAALRWSEQGANGVTVSGVRAFVTAFEVQYYLQADLKAARSILERIPRGAPVVHRALFARWLLAMAERRFDAALQELARTPEEWLSDRSFRGPKALLAGISYQKLGNKEAALAHFQTARRLLDAQMALDAQDEDLHAALALTLASAGQPAEARAALAVIEPLVRGRERNIRAGLLLTVVAQTHAVLGEVQPLLPWLRELLSGPLIPPFTPASLRIDPRFSSMIDHPEVQALLAEFAHLDVKKTAPAQTATSPEAKSIAVLPFANRGDDRETEYFSDGISEELLNVLGRVPGLRVAGWTSALSLKGKNAGAQEVGEKLGVAYFVDGSVHKLGARVKITARLTRTDNNQQVWSNGYEDELKDIFALQDRIARDIADNLQLTLGAASGVPKPVNPDAHGLVLEGRHYWGQRSEDELALAEDRFTRALALDPRFAAAHAGLADVCVIAGLYAENNGASSAGALVARGSAAALRSRELDSTLSEPFAALAYAAAIEGNLPKADQYILQSLALNPNHATAHQWRGIFLERQGRLSEAIAAFETAVALDPLAFVHLWILGEALRFAGNDEQALQALERSMGARQQKVFLPLLAELAVTQFKLGQREKALATARAVRDSSGTKTRWWADGYAVWVMHRCGEVAEAEAYARALRETLPRETYQHGVVLAALGRFDEAIPYLARTPQIARRILFWGELFEPYRDGRMEALMRKLGCADDYRRARESLPPARGTVRSAP